MIVWGTSTKKIGTIEIGGTCKVCNTARLCLVGLQRMFSLFWIPTIPLEKNTYISCLSCGSEYQIKENELKAQEKNLNFKTPWWSFSGLIIIIMIILFGIYEDNKSTQNIQDFKNNPSAGRYFTFKVEDTDDENLFSLGKIEEIKDNKILVRFGNYAYSRKSYAIQDAKDSKYNSDKKLHSESTEFNIQDFQKIDIQEVIGN